MGALGSALGLSAGLITLAMATYAVAAMVQSRSLPVNGLIGIRTRATRASEAAWVAGHDAARPALLTAAVVSLCGVVVTVVVGVALGSRRSADLTVVVVGLSAYAVVLAVVAFATYRADAAARRAGPGRTLGDP